jgi:hypothetical protein
MNILSDCVMLSTQQYPEGRTSRYPPVCTYETLARQAIGELACLLSLLSMLLRIKNDALKQQFSRRVLTQHTCIEVFSAAVTRTSSLLWIDQEDLSYIY